MCYSAIRTLPSKSKTRSAGLPSRERERERPGHERRLRSPFIGVKRSQLFPGGDLLQARLRTCHDQIDPSQDLEEKDTCEATVFAGTE